MTILVTCTPLIVGTRGSRGMAWIAHTLLDDGSTFTARSRSGAPNELARMLVAANIPDQPMQVFDTHRDRWTIKYRSFHEAAKWTYAEGAATPLRRVRWTPRPEINPALHGEPENRGEKTPPVGFARVEV